MSTQPGDPLRLLAVICWFYVVGFPFNLVKVKLLPGDLRTAQELFDSGFGVRLPGSKFGSRERETSLDWSEKSQPRPDHAGLLALPQLR